MSTTDALVVRQSRARVVRLVLVALVFVLIGVAMLADGGWTAVVGGLTVVLFGFALVLALRQVVRSGQGLVIDREGIVESTSSVSVGRIPWAAVAEVEPFTLGGQRYLGIGLVDREGFLAGLAGPQRALLRRSADLAGHDLNIPLQTLKTTDEELMDAVARLRP